MDHTRKTPYPNNIRALREAGGLSLEELSERSGIKLIQLERLETDVPRPNLSIRKKLARTLNCSPEDLLLDDARDDHPNRIRAHREAAGMEISELAQKSGLHSTVISDLERMRRNPPRFMLEAVARVLDCAAQDLLHEQQTTTRTARAPRSLMTRIDDIFLEGEHGGQRPTPKTLSLDERRNIEAAHAELLEEIRALKAPEPYTHAESARFPNKLSMLRKLAGLSQTELARGIGVTQGTVSQLELGSTMLRPSRAKTLAEALGCEPEDFFYTAPNGKGDP